MFQKFLCTLITTLFLLATGQGQTVVVVEGHVRFGETLEPVRDYPVWLRSSVLENGEPVSVRTDNEGFYRLEARVSTASLPSLDSVFVVVQVYDFCSGALQQGVFELLPESEWRFAFDAVICRGVNPPPPPVGCEAFFSYRQLNFDNLEVAFTNLSFVADTIRQYLWEFGDGEQSEEINPVHRYPAPGVYPVSLMIEGEDCTSHYAVEIYVSDREDCVCTTEYNPVCVVDEAGEQVRFSNACLARCAGYGADDFVRCEDIVSGCDCPAYYDPVCVAVGQDTLTFANYCFAECEGYLPHQFIPCYPDTVDICYCFTIYDPVCIFTPDGDVLSFSNACEAECAGYQPAQMVDCNGVEYCRAAFFVERPDPVESTFIFMDNSRTLNDHIVQWKWDFGDGEVAEEPAPLHTYAEPGTYRVRLAISTERGCNSETAMDLQVGVDSTCYCPRIYAPVCVVIDSVFVASFPNACEANCAGFQDYQLVSCDPDQGCPEIYDPVCVYTPGGDVIEFPNACYAEQAGFTRDHWVSCDNSCICPAIFDPVCVLVEGEVIQFGNACEAECRGFTAENFVDCNAYECVCPLDYNPVCVLLDSGEQITFSNACQARCKGYTDDQFVPCENDCICDAVYDPVCVAVGQDTLTFTNRCFAFCAGFDADQLFRCGDSDCICPDIYDPVCVRLPDGTLREFSNRCEAECAGFGAFEFVDCEIPPVCDCPDVFSPVCVVLPDGRVSSFNNACYAKCAGYEAGQFIDCSAPWACDCPLEFDPVCVVNDEGVIVTLPNPCVAECRGYTRDVWVDCAEQGCFANFEIKTDPDRPLSVRLVSVSRSSEGAITRFDWELEDDIRAEGPEVEYTFPYAGVWPVALNIQTEEGCGARIVRRVLVGDDTAVAGPDCRAMFFFEQDSIAGHTFRFVDMSMGEARSWLWEFGDGQVSTEPSPVHRYEEEGVYLVRLTIKADYCASSAEMVVYTADNVTYDNECRALFMPFIEADSNAVFFLNLSTPDALYEWDFGDGTTKTGLHVLHTYEEPGTYEVKLTIATDEGCVSHFTATINLETQDFRAAPEYFAVSGTDDLPELEKLTLYPNPVRDRIQLQFESQSGGRLDWQVINLDGVVLSGSRLDLITGENQTSVDVSQLPSGLYLLRLRSGAGSRTLRFVKQ